MIEVRLFGRFRRLAADPPPLEAVVHLPAAEHETLGQVLARLGVDPAEVGNVFVNGRLLPRSSYPILLGYPLAAERPLLAESYLATPVQAGDRLGIFPRNMASVVV